jgi:membrane protein DedA with SNARE-associated domain
MNPDQIAPLVGLVGLVLVKEAGVPVPVPGDLVLLGAGVAAARGDLDPRLTLVALILASIAGGLIQYAALRSVARPAILLVLSRFTSPERIESQTERLRRNGAPAIAVGRMTPGFRTVTVAASALAAVPASAFVGGLSVGNAVFISAHFGIGYVLGEPAIALIGRAALPIAVAGVVLAILGLGGWLLIRRRREAGKPPLLETIAAWADACCPACVSIGAAARRGSTVAEADSA